MFMHSTAHTDTASAIISIVWRAAASIIAISLLTSTTPFPKLLAAFQSLRAPAIILALLAFLYRFIYILFDELERIDIGRKSRTFSNRLKLGWRARGWMLGTFLIRSIEKSERVYQAMLARGFTGKIVSAGNECAASAADIAIAIAAILLCIVIRIGAA
jgi:cobalt/nickel transport system permease protein